MYRPLSYASPVISLTAVPVHYSSFQSSSVPPVIPVPWSVPSPSTLPVVPTDSVLQLLVALCTNQIQCSEVSWFSFRTLLKIIPRAASCSGAGGGLSWSLPIVMELFLKSLWMNTCGHTDCPYYKMNTVFLSVRTCKRLFCNHICFTWFLQCPLSRKGPPWRWFWDLPWEHGRKAESHLWLKLWELAFIFWSSLSPQHPHNSLLEVFGKDIPNPFDGELEGALWQWMRTDSHRGLNSLSFSQLCVCLCLL